MKSVLISIRPQWVEKIASGKKTIEVRKTAPKEVPFKAYIYETYDKKYDDIGICWGNGKCFEHGCKKVIGEFICDKVDEYKFHEGLTEFNSMGLPSRIYGSYLIFTDDYKSMCLSYDEVKTYGKGKTLFGWHISDLKIYDKSKELSEFVTAREKDNCDMCGVAWESWNGDWHCTQKHCDGYHLSRPPQSWCYAEKN